MEFSFRRILSAICFVVPSPLWKALTRAAVSTLSCLISDTTVRSPPIVRNFSIMLNDFCHSRSALCSFTTFSTCCTALTPLSRLKLRPTSTLSSSSVSSADIAASTTAAFSCSKQLNSLSTALASTRQNVFCDEQAPRWTGQAKRGFDKFTDCADRFSNPCADSL